MAREAITRTAPGWEERTYTLLPLAAHALSGVSDGVTLRPGFARVALLLEVTAIGLSGVRAWVQHSPDGERWADLAAFETQNSTGAQVAWVEAQPELAGGVFPLLDGEMAEGEVHQGFTMSRLRVRWFSGGAGLMFGVEAVAIYERR
jgi:hypothetical protein